ncbi:MAG: AAA family ATPase [Bacteroidales bacterium]|jgi:CYTH domain-containing protein/thymidylate kinase|nr:AAA family ATPase [Bacteroidales bacterium]
MNNIKRIVLTGGPCAGKTTALVRINSHFSALGYKVFMVPEVPTMITQAGWNYLTDNHDFYYEGEKVILETQLELEDKVMRMAQTCKEPCVVVCDRGAMDISAYISPEMWNELTRSCGTSTEELRTGGRYDAVLHLVSAADGAEKFYTTANNAQRYEKADEAGLRIARELDKKVIQAWTGHPHLRVINNGEDFERKMNRVLREISAVLELPLAIEEERKYRVKVTGQLPDCTESEITQTYLTAEPDCEIRLRRRSANGYVTNIHTTRKRLSPTEELVTERQVSNALYESLLQQADPYRRTIHKSRRSFIYQGQFFELDSYAAELDGLVILETKGIGKHEEMKLPPFLEIVDDITGNTAYLNYNLALRR